MIDPVHGALAAILVLGYTVQTVSGFGSMVVVVTLGAHLLPISDLVALVVPVSLLQTGWIAVRHRDGTRWDLLLRGVLPLMGGGMLVGFAALSGASSPWMKRAFGVMVVVLAVRELWRLGSASAAMGVPLSRPVYGGALFGAGVIHGVFATGGPLLVYALSRTELSKKAFRATVTTVWLVLNLVLSAGMALDGRYDADALGVMALLACATPVGLVVGEYLHHRVDELRFKRLVYVVLALAALSLVVR